ncbi:BRO1-domain-containing protein [Metschnikowia bicuspidata var. bicuspidata NRRL YB-4993]|uniref:BRO1-domain-containing protein n=1 Tax=Metschnikowia bicuspidata var. bicuspidata NRRL YB-4993 TaxID=869754 RepID=A0A1A0H8P3_9ASCO|nr:BRO1-domain-containing protein [Metschnikowia bicuspidata var. bicuspidata NRRL YB-4993]OBA20365.1 BRO1-domain-containing protein [Metschnikowia bicuspidata var. bicuspidata NRRL YB-4993]
MHRNLLSVPLRIAEGLELDKTLAKVIERDFYQPAAAFDDLARAQSLHMALVSGSKTAAVDTQAYEHTLTAFFYLVQDLRAKFPDYVATFEWYDTLQHRQPVLQARDWRLEALLVAYQMGVLHSRAAHGESGHADDGVKKACAQLQAAAGCFQYLLDQQDGAPLPAAAGLDAATVGFLRVLMLSQAQELIWQKAARNPAMKDTLVARLASTVADLYEAAATHGAVSSAIRQEWLNHVSVKRLHFRAAALYRMATNARDTFQYGVQVAYLRSADLLCHEALRHSRYVGEPVLEDLGGLQKTVAQALRTAEKDNDLVYLKPVPEAGALPAIQGASMVEPKLPLLLAARDAAFAPAFAALLPFAVVQVSHAFRERQDAFIGSAFREPLRALTQKLRRFLAERQLPAALDTMQAPESIPDSIVQHAQEILSIGGTRVIVGSMGEVSILAANSRALVEECEERLRLEQKEDDLMREREGPDSWTRTPSNTASAKHWATIAKMREYLDQGQQSDALLGEIYGSLRNTLDVYCGGHELLLKHIPRDTHVYLSQPGERVALELRDLLAQVSALETKRERFQSSIDLKSRNHSILSVVVDAFKRNPDKFQKPDGSVDRAKFEPVYEKHISFFNSDLAYLAQLKELQVALEGKIDDTKLRFDHFKAASLSKAQEARLKVLQTLENDYVRYLELVQNLNLASRFYTTFLERGNTVLRELDEFLLSRREEARELALHIRDQRNFEGIELSMARNLGHLAAPRLHKANIWDPSKGIRFS